MVKCAGVVEEFLTDGAGDEGKEQVSGTRIANSK